MISAEPGMERRSLQTAAGILVILAVSACAGDSSKYPSLAIRDIERTQGQFTPVAPEPPAPIRPVASEDQLGALVSRAQQSHSRFLSAQGNAATLVGMAKGTALDSNTRQRALIALADLTSLRSTTASVVADLDLLIAEASNSFAPTDEIVAAQEEVLAMVAAADQTLDALSEELGR